MLRQSHLITLLRLRDSDRAKNKTFFITGAANKNLNPANICLVVIQIFFSLVVFLSLSMQTNVCGSLKRGCAILQDLFIQFLTILMFRRETLQ
jgi:hypothetical protein